MGKWNMMVSICGDAAKLRKKIRISNFMCSILSMHGMSEKY